MDPQAQYVQASAPQSKPESSSPFGKIIIMILTVLVCLGFGAGGYFLGHSYNKPSNAYPKMTATPTQPTTTASARFKKTSGYEKFVVGDAGDPANGLKFQNPQHNYFFQYPANWDVFVDEDGKFIVVTSVDNAKTLRETLYGGADGVCHPLGPISINEISQQDIEDRFIKHDQYSAITSQPTTVDGVSATQYVDTLSLDPCGSSSEPNKLVSTTIIASVQGVNYAIALSDSVDPEKEVLFAKFLKTFHFISK